MIEKEPKYLLATDKIPIGENVWTRFVREPGERAEVAVIFNHPITSDQYRKAWQPDVRSRRRSIHLES